jgi:hypothetical protein
VVEKAWAEAASNTNGVLSKLNQVHAFIHEWDFAVLKQPKRRLRKAQKELQNAMNGPMNDENDTKAKEAANLTEILLEQEEVHWAQRSRANLLQHGDRNTSFFTILRQPVERKTLSRNYVMITTSGSKVQIPLNRMFYIISLIYFLRKSRKLIHPYWRKLFQELMRI